MAAHILVHAGWRVLMLERGDWVPRGPASWRASQAGLVSPFYSTESCYRVQEGRRQSESGGLFCVGGPSVFYGGASLRYRESDFTPDPQVHGASGAQWPLTYGELEPFYTLAEQLLGVVGTTGGLAGVAGDVAGGVGGGVGACWAQAALTSASAEAKASAGRHWGIFFMGLGFRER